MLRLILLFILAYGLIPQVFAEGSKELEQAGGTTKVLVGVMGAFDAPADRRIHIRIGQSPDERIYFGFGNVTQGSSGTGAAIPLFFRIRNPQGQIVEGPSLIPTSGAGFIANRSEAFTGPNLLLGNSGGYQPLVFAPIGPGDYYIEFSRNPNQPSGLATLEFLDITVANSQGTQQFPGRLWCRQWELNCLSFANLSFSRFFTYTNDSTITRISLNGMQPLGFSLSCNSTGVSKTGNLLNDRKSVQGNTVYPEYRLFLNNPDSIEFPTGRRLSNDDFTYDVFGCLSSGYCIRINSNRNANAQVVLDIDGTSGFQPAGADRILEQRVGPGMNCISWDGKDGIGRTVNLGAVVRAKVSLISGLTHLPIFDAENNSTGFDVSLVRPSGPRPLLFWDDSQIPGGTVSWSGCANPCRSWNQIYGDNKTLNTWWFSESSEQNISFTIVENCPLVANNDSSKVVFGDSVYLKVWANDADLNRNIDSLSVQILHAPRFGTARIEGSKLIYSAYNPVGFVCKDSLYYKISDRGPIPNDANGKFSDSAWVYFFITPPKPIVADTFQSFCIDSPNKTLIAETVEGRFNLIWFGTATGGRPETQTPLIGVNQPLMGAFFVAQQFAGSNCLSERVRVRFQVLGKPNPSFIGPDSVLCLGAGPLLITSSDANAVITVNGIRTNIIQANALGKVRVKSLVRRGPCLDSAVKEYKIIERPLTDFVLPRDYCITAGPISLQAPSAGGVFSGSGVSGNTLTLNTPGNYRVVFKNNNGLCLDSMVKTISVFDQLQAGFTVADTLVCQNSGPILLSPLTQNGVFTSTGTILNNRFIPNRVGRFTIKRKVINGPCTDSLELAIRVIERAVPRFLGVPNRVCNLASPLVLTGSPTGGAFSGPGVSGSLFFPTLPGRYDIKYKVSQAGCIDSTIQAIEVVPQQKAGFTIADSVFCVGDGSIALNAISAGGSFSGFGVSGNVFSPVIVGTYQVKHKISFGGCSDSVSKTMIVHPKPFVPSISGFGDSLSALSGGARSFRWFNQNGALPDTVRKIRALAGTYRAVAIGVFCNSDTSAAISFIPTGLKNSIQSFNIYPNPMGEKLWIDCDAKDLNWQWFNAEGKALSVDYHNFELGVYFLTGQLPKGFYLLKSDKGHSFKLTK